MITENKITGIFCIADDFCKVFDAQMEKYTIKCNAKRKYHRESTMSMAEIMVSIILFHSSGYRCLKHFYNEYVCAHLGYLFPDVVGDNDDHKPLVYKALVDFIYGKLVGDKGYISKNPFNRLFVDGIQLITKLKSNMKGAIMKVADRLLLRKRAIIETINDELRNIAQMEHSRHNSFGNFMVNALGALATYCIFPKKPTIAVQRTIDRQLALF